MFERHRDQYQADTTRIVVAAMTFVALLIIFLVLDGCMNLNSLERRWVLGPAAGHG
jgi:hypothetical protein